MRLYRNLAVRNARLIYEKSMWILRSSTSQRIHCILNVQEILETLYRFYQVYVDKIYWHHLYSWSYQSNAQRLRDIAVLKTSITQYQSPSNLNALGTEVIRCSKNVSFSWKVILKSTTIVCFLRCAYCTRGNTIWLSFSTMTYDWIFRNIQVQSILRIPNINPSPPEDCDNQLSIQSESRGIVLELLLLSSNVNRIYAY